MLLTSATVPAIQHNSTSDTVVVGTADADNIYSGSKNVTIQALGGNDTIENRSDTDFLSKTDTINVVIDGGDGNDNITNMYDASPNVEKIRRIAPDNYFSLSGRNGSYEDQCSCHVAINGGNGEDHILNSGYTANLYNGHDGHSQFFINVYYGDYVTIDGGDGNDTIENKDGDHVNINGGAGDDYIYNSGVQKPILYYGASPDYTDLTNSSLSVSLITDSAYYGTSFGNNVILDGNSDNDTIVSNGGDNITLSGGAGDDSLIGSSSNDKEIFVYNSGNDAIQNYNSNDRLIFDARYTGWTTNDDDLMIYAAEGSVRIQNANYKWVELADVNGNVVAHVHLAGVNEDSIDGRSYDGFEVISGSNIANQIYAGSGGSSLYGGLGGNDELYGNVGYDEFVYCYGDGQDSIFNASAEDAINLNGVNLEQLTTAEITNGGVNLGFADGGALNINGQVGTFILGGQRFGADYQNKSWYAK